MVEVGLSTFHKQDAEFWLLHGHDGIRLMITVDLYITAEDWIRLDISKYVKEKWHAKCESRVSAEHDREGRHQILDPFVQITFSIDW